MIARQASAALVVAVCAAVGACDDFRSNPRQAAGGQAAQAQPASNAPARPAAPNVAGSQTPLGKAIETADAATATNPSGASSQTPSNVLIRVETLLDRAHFSPGVIDGRPGTNLTNALAAYRTANNLGEGGVLDAGTLDALAKANPGAVTADYTITEADQAGPFIGPVGEDFVKLQKLTTPPGYQDVVQELSARFHMSEGLLKALNPGADFTKPGQQILVLQPGAAPLPSPAAKLEVDKATNQVRAFDQSGKIEAVFPATVGSVERPAPSGELEVVSATANPDYTYDPSKLTFGPRKLGKFTIKPGPNNPVGTTWIALNRQSYGIHGTPDPTRVGKTASHGCVRLTNWDADTLRAAVRKGTPVDFVGETTKTSKG